MMVRARGRGDDPRRRAAMVWNPAHGATAASVSACRVSDSPSTIRNADPNASCVDGVVAPSFDALS